MSSAKDLMFAIIKSEIFGDENTMIPETVDEETLKKLYRLSCKHDIAHIVAAYLEKHSLLPDGDAKAAFNRQKMLAIFRREQQNHELSRICAVLEEEKIDYIPLKGSVIKSLYREDWMRTSSDIDILIRPESYEKAVKAITDRLNYRFDYKSLHDCTLFSKNGVNLELHFAMKSKTPEMEKTLNRIWEFCYPAEGFEHRFLQSNEFIAFYNIEHIMHHFISGGCGVRPFIDLKLIENKLNPNDEIVCALMEEGGGKAFYDGVKKLEKVWFEGEDHSELTAMMEEFILTGGVYGNRENYGIVARHKKGSKAKYYLSRIFVPKERLVMMSPKCEKYPILMPYYQVKRWFMLFDKEFAKATKSEIKGSKKSDMSSVMLRELGL